MAAVIDEIVQGMHEHARGAEVADPLRAEVRAVAVRRPVGVEDARAEAQAGGDGRRVVVGLGVGRGDGDVTAGGFEEGVRRDVRDVGHGLPRGVALMRGVRRRRVRRVDLGVHVGAVVAGGAGRGGGERRAQVQLPVRGERLGQRRDVRGGQHVNNARPSRLAHVQWAVAAELRLERRLRRRGRSERLLGCRGGRGSGGVGAGGCGVLLVLAGHRFTNALIHGAMLLAGLVVVLFVLVLHVG
mmetsp:Transcript_43939/g.135637  ORF Transcript_43939/g.135637 Transcript_43939/m.135637 type:complete len:242 (+) Transcript_43939:1749-2474(+)